MLGIPLDWPSHGVVEACVPQPWLLPTAKNNDLSSEVSVLTHIPVSACDWSLLGNSTHNSPTPQCPWVKGLGEGVPRQPTPHPLLWFVLLKSVKLWKPPGPFLVPSWTSYLY